MTVPRKRTGRLECSPEIKAKFDEGKKGKQELIKVMLQTGRDKEHITANALHVCVYINCNA